MSYASNRGVKAIGKGAQVVTVAHGSNTSAITQNVKVQAGTSIFNMSSGGTRSKITDLNFGGGGEARVVASSQQKEKVLFDLKEEPMIPSDNTHIIKILVNGVPVTLDKDFPVGDVRYLIFGSNLCEIQRVNNNTLLITQTEGKLKVQKIPGGKISNLISQSGGSLVQSTHCEVSGGGKIITGSDDATIEMEDSMEIEEEKVDFKYHDTKEIFESKLNEEDRACAICLDETKTRVGCFLPCGHCASCMECGMEAFRKTASCPICHVQVENFLHISTVPIQVKLFFS